MARKQSSEIERWPEVDEERWPVVEPDEDRWEAARNRRRAAEPEEERWEDERWEPPGRRRTGRLRVEVPPIVNPYAIVALVAALVGLFPVAIVFGLISFSHPRGRAMALFALMIGVAEVMLLAGVIVLSGFTLPRPELRGASTTVATTVVTVASQPPTTTAAPPSFAAPAPTSSATLTPTVVTKGETCAETQAALIGTAADGGTLLCLRGGSGYRWSGPYAVSTAVNSVGAKCVPSTDKTARTADGRALVCERNVWTLWVE
ncbi:DUF4190 domain-containing protein [Nocardia sp. NPDC004068]|uniref:DUF4190 domain-containing protein n=1 Tax=Nocardia sp. NPDC004068 TaxID=3364303 RepID=UPI0036B5BAED